MAKSDARGEATANSIGAVQQAPHPKRSSRKKQQRSIETRRAIISAALKEFAERGFEGASIRRIGESAGLDFTLITYHFRNKLTLWQNVARDSFADIQADWDNAIPPDSPMSAKDQVRTLFRSYFEFTFSHRAFHNFMLRETHTDSARLRWLASEFLGETRGRILPRIREAQAAGELVEADPDILYYMLIGATATFSSMGGEIAATTRFKQLDGKVADQYWDLLDRLFFR